MVTAAKHRKKGRSTGRFTQLHEWVMQTPAWKSLSPTARALYVELKRRYVPNRNGKITLSHREAAEALGVSKNTVSRYYAELQDRGFIEMMQAPHLGPSGVGQAAHWLLTEAASDNGQPAKKTFARWKQS